jgi:hypothetical protein
MMVSILQAKCYLRVSLASSFHCLRKTREQWDRIGEEHTVNALSTDVEVINEISDHVFQCNFTRSETE